MLFNPCWKNQIVFMMNFRRLINSLRNSRMNAFTKTRESDYQSKIKRMNNKHRRKCSKNLKLKSK